MKLWTFGFVFLMSVSALAGGRTVPNAAGGIIRDGAHLTFGSAGIRVELKSMNTVPGLGLLLEAVQGLPIHAKYRGELIRWILNAGDRRYFAIADLTPEIRKTLLRQYETLFAGKVDPKSLTLYAVTSARETYLLPEFFGLIPVQQAAILFHEGIWSEYPELPYETVVTAEENFQRYLEKGASGYDEDFFSSLDVLLQDGTISLKAAFLDDLKSGAIQGLLRDPKKPMIRTEDLLGSNFDPRHPWDDDAAVARMAENLSDYPRSKSMRRLFAAFASHKAVYTSGSWPRTLLPDYDAYAMPWWIYYLDISRLQDRSLIDGANRGDPRCIPLTWVNPDAGYWTDERYFCLSVVP